MARVSGRRVPRRFALAPSGGALSGATVRQVTTQATHAWSTLSPAEVRQVGVTFVQEKIGAHGWRTELVDARSNTMAARRGQRRLEVHVRTVRGLNYAFLPKRRFRLADDRLVAYVRLTDSDAARLYLIPSRAWETPDGLLVSRDFADNGLASEPEYGIQISQKRLDELERFAWHRMAPALLG